MSERKTPFISSSFFVSFTCPANCQINRSVPYAILFLWLGYDISLTSKYILYFCYISFFLFRPTARKSALYLMYTLNSPMLFCMWGLLSEMIAGLLMFDHQQLHIFIMRIVGLYVTVVRRQKGSALRFIEKRGKNCIYTFGASYHDGGRRVRMLLGFSAVSSFGSMGGAHSVRTRLYA